MGNENRILAGLQAELATLADWADIALNDEEADHDRQYIAEYLIDSLNSLANGAPAPRPPF